ncbi:MAG: T9SS type A sorting domain-containing protein [Calditrichaeota bacterium]|nr:T9SS type A sorting domain-containing protein [Calditrichota bacterium]
MKLTTTLPILVLLLAHANSSFAETRVSGDVSGRWLRQGSPFIVTGDVTVRNGQALAIDAGCEVRFEGTKMLIYGRLTAVGSIDDSIRFLPAEGAEAFGGLRFLVADSATVLNYCVVSGGRALGGQGELDSLSSGGNIFVSAGDVTILNSRISGGHCRTFGAGIALWRANTVIENCLVADNNSQNGGGGIALILNANPQIRNTTFVNNAAVNQGGGGIALLAAGRLENCTFSRNRTTNAESGLGGALLITEDATTAFVKCNFLENTSTTGGAINARGHSTAPRFEWCYFWGNSTNAGARVGGAIYVRGGARLEAVYCRFVENNANYGGAIYIKEAPLLNVNHCLFLRNAATRGGGAISTSENDWGENNLWRANNCTFVNNTNIGGERIAQSVQARNGARILLNSCIVVGDPPLFGNQDFVSAVYSHIRGGLPGEGNAAVDPGFFKIDSTYFMLMGNSPCVDSGDPDLPPDRDETRTDRGWLHFPRNVWNGLSTDRLEVELTTIDRVTESLELRNDSGVPVYASVMDRWTEGGREAFINVSQLTNDFDVNGVALAGNNFYLCGGNNGQSPNMLYRLDRNYDLRQSFAQPGNPEDDGYLDLATDGRQLLYGGYRNLIAEFTVDGELGEVVNGPQAIRTMRALGVDFRYSDNFVDFYIGGDEGIIARTDAEFWERDRIVLGDTVRSLGVKGNTRALYAVTEPRPGVTLLWLINPDEHLATPLYTLTPPDSLARIGGVEVTQAFQDGRGSLIGIWKSTGDTPDRLFVVDLYTSWLVIEPSLQLLLPGESIAWPVTFCGDQMPAGYHEGNFYVAVNGYGQGGEVEAAMTSTQSSATDDDAMPTDFQIEAIWPNPFNQHAVVSFNLPRESRYELQVFDVTGRRAGLVVSGVGSAGSNRTVLDAADLPAGVFYLKVVTPYGAVAAPFNLLK